MEIKMKLTFKSIDELDAWFNYVCTRCAMCNIECGKHDPCANCRANKVYKTWEEFFGKEDKK